MIEVDIAFCVLFQSVPRYNFNYAVNDPVTGDNKAQTEVRDGGYVKGSYSLSEPDGTLRVVDYTADPVAGFNAVVKRVGPAAHPQQLLAPVITKQIAPIPAPVLAAPIITAPAYISNFEGLGHGYGYGLEGHELSLKGHGLGFEGHGLGFEGHGLGFEGHGLDLGDYNLGHSGIGSLGGHGLWKY